MSVADLRSSSRGISIGNPLLFWKIDQEPVELLLVENFDKLTEYDALNRMSRDFNWHRGNGSRVAVYLPHYNQRSLLQSESLVVNAIKTSDTLGYTSGSMTTPINDIRYNEKGQRLSISYDNNINTSYSYDPNTFRLQKLDSVLQSTSGGTIKTLQSLSYTYDPSGNLLKFTTRQSQLSFSTIA